MKSANHHLLRTFGLWILSLLLLGSLDAQDLALEEIYHDKVVQYMHKDADSTRFYIRKMRQSDNHCRVLFADLYEATLLYYEGKEIACIEILDDVLVVINQNPQPQNYTHTKNLIGKTYEECTDIIKLNIYRRYFYLKMNRQKFSEAYDHLMQMGEVLNNLPERDDYYMKNEISLTFSLASLKSKMGKFQESNSILEKLNNEIDFHISDTSQVWYKHLLHEKANISVEMGRNFLSLGKKNPVLIDSAESYFKEAYMLTQKIDSNNKKHKAHYYLRKAELDYYRKQFSRALSYADTALTFYTEDESKQAVYFFKSKSHFGKQKHDSAVFYGKKALGSPDGSEVYDILAESYFKLNKLDSAYKYSQLRVESLEKIGVDKEKANSKITKADLNNVLQLNTAIKGKMQAEKRKYWTTIALSLLLLLGILFYGMQKRKSQRKALLALREEYLDLLNSSKRESVPNRKIDGKLADEILTNLKVIEDSDMFMKKDFTLTTLAKLLETNTSYLSRVINSHKNKSFNQYLVDLRMARLLENLESKPLLRKYSIQALAESVGYNNASSFTRAFKKYQGTSPSQYLKDRYQ
ncbi:helix-turn-helix transcriptional regulator [Aureisphaera galaxeae]|uniref:helix-turn-helix transcriptional regulator n=1 Tax=Aureisphaera galaxeae TaxID=1538023 RepID=UPI002350BDAC|nr:helix-turn-helix transcriptional regulator [Aureisphaera galaxeae]MDC8004602.1 helix-turn-helix transcriptional regulator [Aureisphaera galaxeae]